MVIGNGLIAREFLEFKNDENLLIFASGVSNSKTNEPSAFLREIELIKNVLLQYQNSLLIYFSTTSVYDEDLIDTAYVKHKILIESIITSHSKKYMILRLSQVVGCGGNKNNLINFLFEKIKNEEKFDLWNKATRNLIDIEYVSKVVKYILKNQIFINECINIASPKNILVYDIVREIEHVTNKKAVINTIDKGSSIYIDIEPILPIVQQLNLEFDSSYIKNLIRKYY